ncbi:unnamed protein product [Caenorhabditis bovis]|uniref:DNA replication complex GINS protein SLD5 n=1 Tax=Caenorhabditis bovis TaxID=2654633 RepID=A0A8S1ECW0_9PELO|nr:unnamed protein product [Caenorhabditis bovis]
MEETPASSSQILSQFDNEEDDENEEYVTPDAVIKRMTQWWQNEMASPCLLPTQMELVDILLDQIQGMEENIGRQKDKVQLRISIHKMELQRISFMTSDYIRCRLRKIEANPRSVIEEHQKRLEEGQPELLSESELKFAKEYADAEAQLFGKTVLGFMPAALQKIPVPMDDLSTEFSFIRVLEDNVENVSVPDWSDPNSEVILEMTKNSIHLIPFSSIRHLVEEGKIELL